MVKVLIGWNMSAMNNTTGDIARCCLDRRYAACIVNSTVIPEARAANIKLVPLNESAFSMETSLSQKKRTQN